MGLCKYIWQIFTLPSYKCTKNKIIQDNNISVSVKNLKYIYVNDLHYMTFTHHLYNFDIYTHNTSLHADNRSFTPFTKDSLVLHPLFWDALPRPWDLTLHKSQHSQSWKAQLDQKNWKHWKNEDRRNFIVSLEGTL